MSAHQRTACGRFWCRRFDAVVRNDCRRRGNDLLGNRVNLRFTLARAEIGNFGFGNADALRRVGFAGRQFFDRGDVQFSFRPSFSKFLVRFDLLDDFRFAHRFYGLQLAFEKRSARDGRNIRLRQSGNRRSPRLADCGRIFHRANARRRERHHRFSRADYIER